MASQATLPTFNPYIFLQAYADSPAMVRKSDVFEILDSALKEHRKAVYSVIVAAQPALKEECDDSLIEIKDVETEEEDRKFYQLLHKNFKN